MHNLWTPIEDWILEAWCRYVKTQSTQHLSLHFDGLLVDQERIDASDDFIAEAQQAILTTTGYTVEIEWKKPLTLFEIIKLGAKSDADTKALGKLIQAGNCILLVLALLLDKVK